MEKREDWLDDFRNGDNSKRDIILRNLEKTGGPLEHRTSKTLTNLDFHVSRTVYEDIDKEGETVFRDLDIYASKPLHEFSRDNIQIHFQLHLLVECKSPIDTDLIAFEIPSNQMGNIPIRYPVWTNGRHLSFMGDEYYLSQFDEKFQLNAYSDNVKPIKKADMLKPTSVSIVPKENDEEGKQRDLVYSGFGNLLKATDYWMKKTYQTVRMDYNNMALRLGLLSRPDRGLVEDQRILTEEDHIRQKEIEKAINELRQPQDFEFSINMIAPILVVSKDNRILKPVWEETKITDFHPVDCVLYNSIIGEFEKVSKILENRYFGQVLICNESALKTTIKNLEEGTLKLINERMTKNIDKKRVVREILNEVWDPKSLFNLGREAST